jgi:hypothetical protein
MVDQVAQVAVQSLILRIRLRGWLGGHKTLEEGVKKNYPLLIILLIRGRMFFIGQNEP